jgi:hypothetical protein
MRKIFGIALIFVFTVTAGVVMAGTKGGDLNKGPTTDEEENWEKGKDKEFEKSKKYKKYDKENNEQEKRQDRDERKGRHDGDRDRDRRERHSRQEARRILIETNNILEDAKREAERGGYYEGLGRAYSHQREARDLYSNDRRYDRAIDHSLRAREIAKDIIQTNREIQRDSRKLKHKETPRKNYDRHDDLDNSINVKIIDDHAALKMKFKID